jgi:hypothetical protein
VKIECEIPDIKRDEVIEAMAAHLLGALYEGDEDDPEPRPTLTLTIGKHLRVFFDKKIEELASAEVRAAFDETIRARIGAEVDELRETIRVYAQGLVDHAGAIVRDCGVAGGHDEATRAAVGQELLALLAKLPTAISPTSTNAWQLLADTDPLARRMRVSSGWLYQVEHVVIVNPVDARPGFYAFGWHAPTFVPELR